jgi:saccharopine dehydrogenase-like NADP-dependent oxidoreductase
MKTALMIGSTGLIGSYIYWNLLDSDNYEKYYFVKRDRIKASKVDTTCYNFDKPETSKKFNYWR